MANSRKEGKEEETEACGKCVASFSAVFAKTETFFSLCRNPLWLQSMNKFSGVEENECSLIKGDN